MKVRFLRGHEIKDACAMIRNLTVYSSLEDQVKLNESYFLEHLRSHELCLLGYFDDGLKGFVALKELEWIVCLYGVNDAVKKTLLTKVLTFVPTHLNVYTFLDKDLYIELGFECMKQSMVIFGEEHHLCTYNYSFSHVFHSYDEVHDFIASQKDRVYALDNFKHFMDDFCQLQVLLKSIHIGGTNGKGSTTNYVSQVLVNDGYSVATFTSPALVSRLEVMRINNKAIEEDEIILYANRYMDVWLEYELSMFEIEVFIAIMFFIKHKVDFAIFEVGLGGELDATNIIYPIICANTNIGLDHTDYLGDTYEKIARTKGGIIKDYIPFITGEKKNECLNVFKELTQKHHSELLMTADILNVKESLTQITFDYRGFHVVLNTSARYQCENSALAIDILLYLREHGFISLSDECLLEGLKEAVWLGRFEVVSTDPLIIIDGAHNKEGIQAFYDSAKKFEHIKIIFSALRDKDTHAMIEKLLELSDDITVCEFDFHRAQSAVKLAENFPVKIESSWQKAIDDAYGYDGVLFITGSLYFISEVRPYLLKKKGNCH